MHQSVRQKITKEEKRVQSTHRSIRIFQFSNPHRKGKVQERLHHARQNTTKAGLSKGVPIPFKTNSRALLVDLWLHTKDNLWLLNDAVWRKSGHAI